jgi:Fe-S cluster biosynthesis and repair protein YggX
MFINEYRLNMLEPKAREFLAQEMEKFLFSDESQTPAGYVPPENNI